MKILVLNGSPRKSGTIATIINAITTPLASKHEIKWIDVCDLQIKYCTGCMACRATDTCVLPQDDAQRIGEEIKAADLLIVGTPTYWGNMCAPLKLLFDRLVPIFMGESPRGIPIPRLKGKKAIIVTACTTPWPFSFIFPEIRGTIKSVKEVLKYGGYKIKSISQAGTKNSKGVPKKTLRKAEKLGGYYSKKKIG